MFFTVYRITNTVNGRYYIGKHLIKNINDGYFGSGKLLQQALRKYGKAAFVREIIFFAFDKDSMDWAEQELVVPNTEDALSYNLKTGGEGGAAHGVHNPFFGKRHTQITKERLRNTLKGRRRSPRTEFKPGEAIRKGTTLSEEHKLRLSQHNKEKGIAPPSKKNTRWITNGSVNQMIDASIPIPEGFVAGRIYRRKLEKDL